MRIKRVVGGLAIAGMVGASALGVGAGFANAAPAQQEPAVAVVQPAAADSGNGAAVQPVDWHGHGYGHGGYGHWGGWYGGPWWHHWGW